jgi:hypothetical protein
MGFSSASGDGEQLLGPRTLGVENVVASTQPTHAVASFMPTPTT